MQLLSKYNKGIRFLLCVTDVFSKYAWVVPLKDKKGISIVKAFQSILNQSNSRKPNKSTKVAPHNHHLAEELHKPIVKKFVKRKVHAAFKDNIWGAD